MAKIWVPQPPDVIRHWLVSLQDVKVQRKLSPWEKEFVANIDWQLYHSDGKPLTQRQQEVLEKIYAEKT